jgi:hypothetical protein
MATQAERISALASAIGYDIKSINSTVGLTSNLTTAAKNNIVAALNEVNQIAKDAALTAVNSTGIDDTAVSTEKTWSSNKINTEINNTKSNIGDTTQLANFGGSATVDIIKALTYLNTQITSALNNLGAKINDSSNNSTSETWSANKIYTSIATAVSDLVDSSPAALDTLNELATALGNDTNFATTLATQMGYRVRVDAPQNFSAEQQKQGCENLGIGDPNIDFVTIYTNAKTYEL